jgi:hypothetical protein
MASVREVWRGIIILLTGMGDGPLSKIGICFSLSLALTFRVNPGIRQLSCL